MTWQRGAQNLTKVLECDSLIVYLPSMHGALNSHPAKNKREERGWGRGGGEEEG